MLGAGREFNHRLRQLPPARPQRRLQGLLLGFVERTAHHSAARATQCGKDLVGCHLTDQQEQRGIARLQRSRSLPHELVVDAEIGQLSAERTGSRAGERHYEEQPD